jgi:hypothetical protein
MINISRIWVTALSVCITACITAIVMIPIDAGASTSNSNDSDTKYSFSSSGRCTFLSVNEIGKVLGGTWEEQKPRTFSRALYTESRFFDSKYMLQDVQCQWDQRDSGSPTGFAPRVTAELDRFSKPPTSADFFSYLRASHVSTTGILAPYKISGIGSWAWNYTTVYYSGFGDYAVQWDEVLAPDSSPCGVTIRTCDEAILANIVNHNR